MKKLLLILLTPIIFLTSCSKSGVTPQTMENVIVGKKWWDTIDKEGMLLSEEGKMYYIQVCQDDSLMGDWIIEEDIIKLRFYINSIEYTSLVAEVTSYTDTELRVKVATNDTNLQANYVLTTDFTEILGCTDSIATNYNQLANCDDGSCNYSGTHTFIPDDNFEQALIDKGYDTHLDDYVLTSNINTIEQLDLMGGNPISELTGIEDFTALTTLICRNHQITSLDLSQNTALEKLWCYNNNLTSLDLSNNTALEEIICHNNQITSLNLNNHPDLIRIECNNNQLSFLDVSNSLNLEFLKCNYNQLSSLDVSNNIELGYLSCYGNQLTILDVSQNTALTHLYIGTFLGWSVDAFVGNNISNIDISNNNNLKRFHCDFNKLTSLDISNLTYDPTVTAQFSSTNNPNLFCIEVDNVQSAYGNFGTSVCGDYYNVIDPHQYYSENCP